MPRAAYLKNYLLPVWNYSTVLLLRPLVLAVVFLVFSTSMQLYVIGCLSVQIFITLEAF